MDEATALPGRMEEELRGKQEVATGTAEAARRGPTYLGWEVVALLLLGVLVVGLPLLIFRYEAARAAGAGAGRVWNVVARNDGRGKGVWLIRPAGVWSYSVNGAHSRIVVRQGERVTLRLSSVDVHHEFSLPEYGIKQDVAPGKVSVVTFQADKPGTFRFECTSYCRLGHDKMAGTLTVLPAMARAQGR